MNGYTIELSLEPC